MIKEINLRICKKNKHKCYIKMKKMKTRKKIYKMKLRN